MRGLPILLMLLVLLAAVSGVAQETAPSSAVLRDALEGDYVFVGYRDLSIVFTNASITGKASIVADTSNSSRITGNITLGKNSLLLLKAGGSRVVVVENTTARAPRGWGALGVAAWHCQVLAIRNIVLSNISLLVNASGCMEVYISNIVANGPGGSILVRGAPIAVLSGVEVSSLDVEGIHVEMKGVDALKVNVKALGQARLSGMRARTLSVSGPRPGSHSGPSPLVELRNSSIGSAILLGVSEAWVGGSNMSSLTAIALGSVQVTRSSLERLTVFSGSLALTDAYIAGRAELAAERVLIYNSTLVGPAPLLSLADRTREVKIILSKIIINGTFMGGTGSPLIGFQGTNRSLNVSIIGSTMVLGNRTLLSTRSRENITLNILASEINETTSIADARASRLSIRILASKINQSPSAGPAGGQLVGEPLFSAGQGTVLILASALHLESPLIAAKPSKGTLTLTIARSRLDASPGIGQQIYNTIVPGVNVNLAYTSDPCWAGNDYTYTGQILGGPGIYGVQDPAPGRGPEPGECKPSTVIMGVPVSYEEGNLTLAPRAYGLYAVIYPGNQSLEAHLAGTPVEIETLALAVWAQLVHAIVESTGLGRYKANITLAAGGTHLEEKLLLASPAPPVIVTLGNKTIPLEGTEKIVYTAPGSINITLAPTLTACTATIGPALFPETWQKCGEPGETLTANWSPATTGPGSWTGVLIGVQSPGAEPRYMLLLAGGSQEENQSLAPHVESPETWPSTGSLALAAGLAGALLLVRAVRQG